MNRPRVRGTVGILILRGLLSLFQGFSTLDTVGQIEAQGNGSLLPGWIRPLLYLVILIGVLSLVGAVLIARYKRWGLLIGGAAVVIDLAALLLLVVTGESSLSLVNIVSIVVSLAILYYIYKYLTQEPEKSAFT